MKLKIFALIAGVLSAGCTSTQNEAGKPAVLTESSAQVYQEIQDAIVTLIGGERPRLAPDVFMNNSEVVLETGLKGLSQDQQLALTKPRKTLGFQLQKRNKQCVVFHFQSQQYAVLKNAFCELEN